MTKLGSLATLVLMLGTAGCMGAEEEEHMLSIEHYKVPCQECGIACMDYLCFRATDNGAFFGTFTGIKGFTSYRWGTRYIMNVTVTTPGDGCMDCGGPTAELDELLESTVQPAGTPFELGLTPPYLAEGTESDLRLIDPDGNHTERHLACEDATACEPLYEVIESTEYSAGATVTLEHPSDPSWPLLVVSP